MSATAVVSEEVTAYMASVRAALADLPPEDRDDLLAEVEASLVDAEAEGGPVAERLGPPERFAAELRSAAGLQGPDPASAPQGPKTSTLDALRAAIAGVAAHPRVANARRVAVELAPLWWVVRGYAGVAAVAAMLRQGWSMSVPVVPSPGDKWAFVIVAAIVASVLVGLRARRSGRPASRPAVFVNLALFVASLSAGLHVVDIASGSYVAYPEPYVIYEPVPPSGSAGNVTLDNIYPYDSKGRLLHDVLLYDSQGKPLDFAAGDPNRRLLFDRTGQPVLNSYPIRYFEPGTRRVANPDAGPKVKPPAVVASPLKPRARRRP